MGLVLSIDADLRRRSSRTPAAITPTRRAASSPGPSGSDRPVRFIPMLNAARSPTFYEFDSADLLALYKEMDANDEEPS